MLKIINRLSCIFKPRPRLFVAFDSGGKNKKTIILLHGIAATSKTWDVLIKELDVKKYRIIALDLLGFGNSPKPKGCEYSIDDHVDSLHRTIKKLNIRRAYQLVGHSMGAIIAARYSCKYDNEVNRLYLLSLPFYPINDESFGDNPKIKTNLFLDVYNFLSTNKQFTINNSQFIRKLLRLDDGIDVNENNWVSFRLSLQNTIIKQDVYSDMKNLKMPIKIIYGDLDLLSFSETIDQLAKFKNVDVIRLKGVTHIINKPFAKSLSEEIGK